MANLISIIFAAIAAIAAVLGLSKVPAFRLGSTNQVADPTVLPAVPNIPANGQTTQSSNLGARQVGQNAATPSATSETTRSTTSPNTRDVFVAQPSTENTTAQAGSTTGNLDPTPGATPPAATTAPSTPAATNPPPPPAPAATTAPAAQPPAPAAPVRAMW